MRATVQFDEVNEKISEKISDKDWQIQGLKDHLAASDKKNQELERKQKKSDQKNKELESKLEATSAEIADLKKLYSEFKEQAFSQASQVLLIVLCALLRPR